MKIKFPPVIKFLFTFDYAPLSEALQFEPKFESISFTNSSEMYQFLSKKPGGVILTYIGTQEDLNQLNSFMKIFRKMKIDDSTKIVAFNFTSDKNLIKILNKMGIREIIEPGINSKDLKFKLDFWQRSLLASKEIRSNSHDGTINWDECLPHEDDIWIIKSEDEIKKVMSKWLLRIEGPGLGIGKWEKVGNNFWRFDLRKTEKHLFIHSNGQWYFKGDAKPKFDWEDNIWLMNGNQMELYFKEGNKILHRFKASDLELSIRKNSNAAKKKENLIHRSFLNELHVKVKSEKYKNTMGEVTVEHPDQSQIKRNLATFELKNSDKSKKMETAHAEQEKQSPIRLESTQNKEELFHRQKDRSNEILETNDKTFEVNQDQSTIEESDIESLTQNAHLMSYITHLGKKIPCQLSDYFDHGFIFIAENKNFVIGSSVTIDMIFDYEGRDNKIKIIGNISSLDQSEDSTFYITIHIPSSEVLAAQKFLLLFERRQKKVTEFMNKTKGL